MRTLQCQNQKDDLAGGSCATGAAGISALAIVAPSYSLDRASAEHNAHFIGESCRAFALPICVYGVGAPWPGLYQAKVVDLRRAIEDIVSEYVLISDANDAFFLAGEDEILTKFHAGKCSVLISGDRNCWPEPYLQQFYTQSNSPWCYVNSGGYMGSKESLLKLLSIMQNLPTTMLPFERARDWANDQFRLSLAYLTDLTVAGLTLGVDISCQVFQTMHSNAPSDLEWKNDRAINKITGSQPCHLHFNGNWPGMSEAFERRFPCNELATTQ